VWTQPEAQMRSRSCGAALDLAEGVEVWTQLRRRSSGGNDLDLLDRAKARSPLRTRSSGDALDLPGSLDAGDDGRDAAVQGYDGHDADRESADERLADEQGETTRQHGWSDGSVADELDVTKRQAIQQCRSYHLRSHLAFTSKADEDNYDPTKPEYNLPATPLEIAEAHARMLEKQVSRLLAAESRRTACSSRVTLDRTVLEALSLEAQDARRRADEFCAEFFSTSLSKRLQPCCLDAGVSLLPTPSTQGTSIGEPSDDGSWTVCSEQSPAPGAADDSDENDDVGEEGVNGTTTIVASILHASIAQRPALVRCPSSPGKMRAPRTCATPWRDDRAAVNFNRIYSVCV